MHKHFSRDDRSVISSGLRQEESCADIALRISKTKDAVWKEVNRNKDSDGICRV